MITELPPVNADEVPESLRHVLDGLGIEVVRVIMERWGGLVWQVPASPPPDHELWRLFDEETVRRFCAYCGGEVLSVPTATRERRRRMVLDLLADGMSTTEVARHLGMTERAVRRIRNGAPQRIARLGRPADPRQLPMFPESDDL